MISRRRVLQAAAASPSLALLPGVAGAAADQTDVTPTAAGTSVGGGATTEPGSGIIGVSVSWLGTPDDTPVAEVRSRIGGVWGEPVVLRSDHDHGPASVDGRLHSHPVLEPAADAFSVTPIGRTTDLRRHDVTAGPAPLTTQAGGLSTIEPIPGLRIIERSDWTSRSRRDTVDCTLRSSVYGLGCRVDVALRHAVVHHTVNSNDYAASSVPSLLRGIQNHHMDTRGWDDIAYNFIVDRFGRIWHAREGDPYQPITGGHTLGFNAESVGVAVLGTYTSATAPQAVVDAIGVLLGWKLGRAGVDPLGTTLARSSGGTRVPAGTFAEVPAVAGHRHHQQTACPGDRLDARVPEIRSTAAELVPVFGFVEPEYSPTSIVVDGWALERFDQNRTVAIDISVDGGTPTTITADRANAWVASRYSGGDRHGFRRTVPIDLDTDRIVVAARAADGRTATLMDLKLFATFIDVESWKYFAPGVKWMRANGLTYGTRPGLFEPMNEMNRAQMATFLHRFMDAPPPTGPAPFVDVDPGSYYETAVDWLHGTGITTGTTATTYGGSEPVSRAQMATFLWRLCGEQSAPRGPFVDIPRTAYYARAVDWLYAVGVTTGKGPQHFVPDDPVTRGQMATFLYRLATTPAAWTVTRPPSVVDV